MDTLFLGTSSRSLNCSSPIACTIGSLLKGGRGSSGCPFINTSSTIALTSFFSAFTRHTSEVCHYLFDNFIEFFRSQGISFFCKDRTHFIACFWHNICDPEGDIRLHFFHFQEFSYQCVSFFRRCLCKLIGMFDTAPELIGHLLFCCNPFRFYSQQDSTHFRKCN